MIHWLYNIPLDPKSSIFKCHRQNNKLIIPAPHAEIGSLSKKN